MAATAADTADLVIFMAEDSAEFGNTSEEGTSDLMAVIAALMEVVMAEIVRLIMLTEEIARLVLKVLFVALFPSLGLHVNLPLLPSLWRKAPLSLRTLLLEMESLSRK